jgi:hypothetical protein
MIIKKIIFYLILLLIIQVDLYSQTNKYNTADLKNGALMKALIDYDTYFKGFAKKFNIPSHFITVSETRHADTTFFSIDAIYYKSLVLPFNPLFYTLVNNTPVLIHSTIQEFMLPDKGLVNFILTTYWSDKLDTVISKPNSKNQPRSSVDSFLVWDNNAKKAIKVASSNMVEINLKNPHYPLLPKRCILSFKEKTLIDKIWTQEMGVQ